MGELQFDRRVYYYHDGKWEDMTDTFKTIEFGDGLVGLSSKEEEIPDDDIPFCDASCEGCDMCDRLDDYDIVDEDDLPYDDDPPFWGTPDVRRIIFSDPATIVFWDDGTKTVVKCMKGEKFERYAGFAMACMKKMFGSTSRAKAIMNECDATTPNAVPKEKKEPKWSAAETKPVGLKDLINMAIKNSNKYKGSSEEGNNETPAE